MCPQPFSSTTTGVDAADSPDHCLCNEDYFDNVSLTDTEPQCVAVPNRHPLSSAWRHRQSLDIERGYWRPSIESLEVRRCPDAAVGCTDAFQCNASHSGCRGIGAGNESVGPLGCHPTLDGPYCRLCNASAFDGQAHYYSQASPTAPGQCRLCRDLAHTTIISVLGVLVAAGLILLLLSFAYRRLVTASQDKLLRRVWRTFTPHLKLKILLGFYLIATKIDDVYDVEMPPHVKRIVSFFSFAVSFGFSSVGSVLECLGMQTHLAKLLLYTFAPFAIALLILLVGCALWIATSSKTAGLGRVAQADHAALPSTFLQSRIRL